MKTGWIVNLLLLLAVAGLAAYALYKPKENEDAARHAISALPPAQVTRVLIEPAEGGALELQKQGDEWLLVQPLRARADRTQVDRALDLLNARSREKLAASELQRFDLDRPALKVTFNDQSIAFGTTNPLTQEQYVHAGDSVFLLPGYYRSQVPERAQRVLTHALFRQGEKPTAFRLAQFSVEQQDGIWKLAPAAGNEALSQDDLNRWVDGWRLASSLLTQPASGKLPNESIEVRLADGRSLRLRIAQRAPQLVLVREDEKLAFHFSEEMSEQLLAPPAAPEPPPGATSGTGSP
jgi:hypothetical protein